MRKLISWLKIILPMPVINALKPTYRQFLQWRLKHNPKNYQQQKDIEINRFNLEEEVNFMVLPIRMNFFCNMQ